MEETKKPDHLNILTAVFVIVTLGAVSACGFFYGADLKTLIRNGIFTGLLLFASVFALRFSRIRGTLLYDNEHHPGRFFLTCFIALGASCAFPLLPTGGWIFLSVFITLTLFSNELCAFTTGTMLLCVSMMLAGNSDPTVFLSYILPGLLSVLLFSTIGEEFRVFVPLLVSVLMQILTLSVSEVLWPNRVFSVLSFLYPLINTVICVVIVLIVLKIFSNSLIYKEQDRFMDIIDPEFELLSMLRSTSREDYDHAIYTAVLCSKMANRIGLNEPLTKALGYYHRIGVLRGENNWENAKEIMQEYEIPDQVIELLSEYMEPGQYIRSRETTVLLFADTVISSISYLFSKENDAQLNYDKLIGTIFDKKIESGVIDRSEISYGDINLMKKTLIDEKLFYDFLR